MQQWDQRFKDLQSLITNKFEESDQRFATLERQVAELRAVVMPSAANIPVAMETLNVPAPAPAAAETPSEKEDVEMKQRPNKRAAPKDIDTRNKKAGVEKEQQTAVVEKPLVTEDVVEKPQEAAVVEKLQEAKAVAASNSHVAADEEIDVMVTPVQAFTKLKNVPANTCYINSVLQLLFKIPQFLSLLYSDEVQQNPQIDEDQQNLQTLQDLLKLRKSIREFHGLYFSFKEQEIDEKLLEVKKNLVALSPAFNKAGQKDAGECLEYILKSVGYKLNVNETKIGIHPVRGTPITETEDIPSENVWRIAIEGTDLEKMLSSSLYDTKPTKKWSYKRARAISDFTRELKFAVPPKMLFLNIDRGFWNEDQKRTTKISASIPFCQELDLTKHIFKPEGESKYQLAGAIMHLGNMGGGHYCAYLPLGNSWYRVSDDAIEPLEKLEDNKARATEVSVILAYVRM